MGLLDLFRRRPDRTDALSVPTERGPLSDAVAAPAGGSVQRSADDSEASTAVPSAPRAWELLRPIVPLSHAPIHRTFDAYPASSLRAQRSADDLFVSSSLGHTVDPHASGTVDGLLRVTAAGTARDFPAFGSGGDRVLRRRTLGAEELASADEAHPRWPILTAASRITTPASTTSAVPSSFSPSLSSSPSSSSTSSSSLSSSSLSSSSPSSSSASSIAPSSASPFSPSSSSPSSSPTLARTPATETVHRVADDGAPSALGAIAGAVERAANDSQTGDPIATDGMGGTSVSGVVHRSADLVGSSPAAASMQVSSSMSLARPAIARSLDVVSDAARPSLITRVSAEAPSPIVVARTVAPERSLANAPAVRVVDGGVRPTLAAQPYDAPSISRVVEGTTAEQAHAAVNGPIDRALAASPAPAPAQNPPVANPSAAVLRRRSIVEVRPETEAAPSSTYASSSNEATAQRAYETSGSSISGSSDATVARSSEPSPTMPTLGRRVGLGAPLSELPSSAASEESSSGPFGAVYGQDHFDAMLRLANRVDRAVDGGAGAGSPVAVGQVELSRPSGPSTVGGSASSGASAVSSSAAGNAASPFPILRIVSDDSPMTAGDGPESAGTGTPSFTQTARGSAGNVMRSFASTSQFGWAPSNINDSSGVVHRSLDLPLIGARSLTPSLGSSSPTLSGIGGTVPSPGRAVVPLQRSTSSAGAPVAPRLGVAGEPPTPGGAPVASRLGVAGESPTSVAGASLGGNSDAFEHVIARSVAPVPALGSPTIGASAPSGAVPVLPLLRAVDGSGPSQPSPAFVGAQNTAPSSLPSVRAVSASPSTSTSDTAGAPVLRSLDTTPATPGVQPVAPTPSQNTPGPINSSVPTNSPTPSHGENVAAESPAESGGGDGDAGGGGGGGAGGAASTGGGSGAGPSSAAAEAELDQLAGKLYERLRFRLRRELLDDRERAGLVLDRVR